MDPQSLITGPTGPLPAPYWFIQLFKTVGFWMHMIPMNLWFAGILIAMMGRTFGCPFARHFSHRLMSQMPILVALGINFGIVPLLFLQVGYFSFFYAATILTAWFWLSIVAILIPAYYGVYFYAFFRGGSEQGGVLRILVGWSVAGLFLLLGLLFANGLSLMVHVDAWGPIWEKTAVAGATLGLGSNLADANLYERWGIMFGLGTLTTAAWIVLDTAWFLRDVDSEWLAAYHGWTRRAAGILTVSGAILFVTAGSFYVFKTWSSELFEYMFTGIRLPLTVLTAVSPGLVFVACLRLGKKPRVDTSAALGMVLAQLTVLGLNAVSRQVVQNFQVGAYLDIGSLPTQVQWSPLISFLVLLLLGLAVIGWMVAQVIRTVRAEGKPSISR